MRHRVFTIFGAALLAGLVACATPPTIKTGWDKRVDFAKYRTWTWHPDGSIRDEVWARRCQSVLADSLETKKLKEVNESPDLWAVVHARLSTETVVVPYSSAWGYGMGTWGYDESFYESVPVGTLILDLVDVKVKQVVFRGRARGEIQADKSNEEREQNLRKIFAQIFADYPLGAPGAP